MTKDVPIRKSIVEQKKEILNNALNRQKSVDKYTLRRLELIAKKKQKQKEDQ